MVVNKEEQLDVFSFIEEIFDMMKGQEPHIVDCKSVVNQESVDESSFLRYLNKGEKIISLLKDRNQNINRPFKKIKLMESINYSIFNQKEVFMDKTMYLFQSIKSKIIAPTLDEFVQENGEFSFNSFTALFDIFHDRIHVRKIRDTEYEARLIKAFFRNKKSVYDGAIEVRVTGVGRNAKDQFIYCPMSSAAKLTKKQSGRKWSYGSSFDYKICANAHDYFGRFIVLCQFRKMVQDTFKSLTVQELENNIIYNFLSRNQDTIINDNTINGFVYIDSKAYEKEYIKRYLIKQSITLKIVNPEDKGLLHHTILDKMLTVKHFNSIFMLYMNLDSNDWDFIPANVKYDNKYEIDICDNVDISLITHLYEIVADEYIQDAKEESFRKELESDYAKSYMTKKNIPQKHLEAMMESKFNDYFGYVEFDEGTDLIKVEELTTEFRTLADYLHFSKEEEVSLRFRKLGNHKADGLYYPYLKCLCVDVRAPHSMVHEYFHMLDYTRGKLSRSINFQNILSLYKKSLEAFVDSLPAKHNFKLQYYGKTKYNQAYYTQPSEVFARCGEMFLVRTLGINNSLVEIQNDYVYPENDKLKEAYSSYFNEILNLDNIKQMVEF